MVRENKNWALAVAHVVAYTILPLLLIVHFLFVKQCIQKIRVETDTGEDRVVLHVLNSEEIKSSPLDNVKGENMYAAFD